MHIGAAMFRKLIGVCVGLAMMGMAGTASAIVIQYTGYSDFQSTTITSDVGSSIATSGNYTTNSAPGSNSGDPGAGTFGTGGPPMTFAGFFAFEVGMTFGNDQSCCGSTGFFDAILSIFDGATLLGSVTVATNGNDLVDQFIGLGSDTTFNLVTLSYGPGSGGLTRFINRIDIGYDDVVDAPEPSTLALFATGLALLGFIGWRRRKAA